MSSPRSFITLVYAWGEAHPFEAYLRVIDGCVIGLAEDASGHVHLLRLVALHQRRGDGTRVMRRITELADRCGITLTVDPSPLPFRRPARIPQRALRRFYAEFGFRGAGRMIRLPHAR